MVKLKLMKFDSLHIGSWGRLPKVVQPNKAIASFPRTTPALAQIYCARSDDFLKIFLHSGYGKTFMAMASFPRITFALALALDQLIHYD